MIAWAKVKEHRAENITLLCLDHHGQKTRGTLAPETVIAKNRNPWINSNSGESKSNSVDLSEIDTVQLGSNTAKLVSAQEMVVLQIDDLPIISMSKEVNEPSRFNLDLRNRSDEPILTVERNEVNHYSDVWDVQWKDSVLRLRSQPYRVILDVKFFPPGKVWVRSGRFFHAGAEVLVQGSEVKLGGGGDIATGLYAQDPEVMFAIGDPARASVSVRSEVERTLFPEGEVDEWLNSVDNEPVAD